jgi:superfamily II DNA or RNA helicase
MPSEFITNQEKLLTDVVNNILPSSKNLYFLVGYFYFSGFEEIYKNVGDKQVKILVGLEIESNLKKRLKEYDLVQQTNISRGDIRQNYYKAMVNIFNDTDFFDTKEKQEAFKVFLAKIKDGSLEIRKTLQPNHAKLYIFENKEEFNQGGNFPGTIITGSSNLSSSGLRDRFEINVLSRDRASFTDAYDIFKKVWDESIAIVDKNNIKEFLYSVVEKVWIDKLPSPFLLFVRVLEEFFPENKSEFLKLPVQITGGKFINLKYQEDAVARALDILQKHGGVIVADVVGLGKSIVASCIAHNLNKKAIIIAPPHLIKQWEDYHNEFEFHARIYSSGKIEQAILENDEEEKLIIIDEAHKYRNELTADYAALHKLCQNNKIVLLSATPFNNRPQDVFSMVRLFQIPTRSTLQTVDNLSFQFKDLIAEYERVRETQRKGSQDGVVIKLRVQEIASRIRNILYPLVIRRSRLDLDAIQEYKDDLRRQKISFPKVNDPKILEYNLGPLSELYEETLEIISADGDKAEFRGTRYKPVNYIMPDYKATIAKRLGVEENLLKQTQVNVADFMKRLLVRRFESSICAFQSTLDYIIYSSEQISKWYDKAGKVPIYKKGNLPDIDTLVESTGEDLDEELKEIMLDEQLKQYEEKGLWFILKKELSPIFIKDLKRDIEVLKEIREKWFKKGFPDDPKLNGFAKIVKAELKKEPHRKIVVFSEFADTAQYLFDSLKDQLRVFKYSSSDASEANKRTIKENFDAGNSIQKNDYDVLIATDAISEGFNLHRAGIVFNYDIPYNPTRVIQRVGRINRINKKVFDELFIYNFFPTATGERETRVRQISTLKIAMVHALFGEDTRVLTSDEELNSYFTNEFREAYASQEELSPEAKYEDFIRRLRSSQSEIIKEAMSIPKRVRIKRTKSRDRKGVVVFGKKGGEYVFKYGPKPGDCLSLSVTDGLSLFEADIKEESQGIDADFNAIYEQMKNKLFSKRTEVALDMGKRQAIDKVEMLMTIVPEIKDYLSDLLRVIKELDSLPDRYARLIRKINQETLKEDIKELQEQVPHHYLSSIIQKVAEIDDEEESLILSEELA